MANTHTSQGTEPSRNIVFAKMEQGWKNHLLVPANHEQETHEQWFTIGSMLKIPRDAGIFVADVIRTPGKFKDTYVPLRIARSTIVMANRMFRDTDQARQYREANIINANNDPTHWRQLYKVGLITLEVMEQELMDMDPSYKTKEQRLMSRLIKNTGGMLKF